MKKAVFVVLILTLVACAGAVVGQAGVAAPPPAGGPAPPPPGLARPGGPGMMGGGMMSCPAMAVAPPPAGLVARAEALQLSDDQKTKLKDILAKSEETLIPLRQKAAEASRALRQAVFAPEFDAQKVKQLATDAEKAEAAIVSAEIETWAQIRGVLAADQLTKLQELTGLRMGPGLGGGGRRGGPGGQPAPPPPPAEAPPPPPPP